MPGAGAGFCLLLLVFIGGASGGGGGSQGVLRSDCKHRGTATSAPKVKVVLKPIPKPDGKASGDQPAANEITEKEDVVVPYLTGSAVDTDVDADDAPCHDPGPDVSVTTTDDADRWKTNVIIGCTVAAAIEIIIIIVIIAYWREIRWTMRKIACPCDEHPSRHGDHEAMERADGGGHVVRVTSPETRDLLTRHQGEGDDDADAEVEGQTFTHPARSRTQEALDDIINETTPV